MDTSPAYNAVRTLALDNGMALFGVADVTELRSGFLMDAVVAERFTAGISLGFRLSRALLQTIDAAPTQLYYFHYQRANILLDQTALKIMAFIQQAGYDALPIPASQITDWERQLGTLSHREIAYRAGLGWYGKNNLLVNPRFGSQVRYVTILTNMPLPTAQPLENGCGDCSACIRVCPAHAITAEGFDRNACHQKLKEFTKLQRIGQMICGVCLKACPGKEPHQPGAQGSL
jgi:epoxyqueuosine reductase QueG